VPENKLPGHSLLSLCLRCGKFLYSLWEEIFPSDARGQLTLFLFHSFVQLFRVLIGYRRSQVAVKRIYFSFPRKAFLGFAALFCCLFAKRLRSYGSSSMFFFSTCATGLARRDGPAWCSIWRLSRGERRTSNI
jgi:hypothetical protein